MNNDVRNCDCERSQHIWYCTCEKAPNVLMTSDKKAQECDATAASSIDSPLAQKNPLEDITECYKKVSVEKELPEENAICFRGEKQLMFQWKGEDLKQLKVTHWLKKITLPSPAVGGMSRVEKLCEAVQHLFDMKKKKGSTAVMKNAWNIVAINLYDTKKWLEESASPAVNILDAINESLSELANEMNIRVDFSNKSYDGDKEAPFDQIGFIEHLKSIFHSPAVKDDWKERFLQWYSSEKRQTENDVLGWIEENLKPYPKQ